MLKHAKLLFVFLATTLFFSACNEEEGMIQGFEMDKDTISIAAEGGTEYLRVNSASEWVAVSSEPWISISPANGIGSTVCSIVIDSTLIAGSRDAAVYFRSELGTYTVQVYQSGFGKQITLKEPELTIASSTNSAADRYFEATVTTNVPFTVSVEYEEGEAMEWITPGKYDVELDRGSRPRTTTLRFDWKINTRFAQRTARVHFLPQSADDVLDFPAVLTVTQEAAPTITDDRAGDSLAVITIAQRLQLMSEWDVTENMQHWDDVTLWEATDKAIVSGEVPREAVGRVRSANFMMCNTKESIPQEIRYLKYLETLNIYSNVNTMLLSIELGSEVCELEYLKHLQIGAFGLVSLPDDFVKLGDKLETLDLNSNNFTEIPAVLTKENFPRLRSLNLLACRRWSVYDLRKKDTYENGIGLHFNTADNDALKRLLLWDTLEELRLSNNYIEGSVPDFTVGQDGVEAWTAEELAGNDTLKNLIGRPKILPKMKLLTLNLNFFTGNAPDWLLYHPHLLDWYPESLIFLQKENGLDSKGKLVKFDNEPTDFEYYYNFFPGYREKYEMKEEIE